MVTGSCHCGGTSFTFDGLPEQATACNCSVCHRYGTLWAYDWVGERIHTKGDTAAYCWGDKNIEFHHCPTCGCVMFWRGAAPHADGRTRIAVNLRMADDLGQIADIAIRHFDGSESWTDQPDDGRTIRDMWF